MERDPQVRQQDDLATRLHPPQADRADQDPHGDEGHDQRLAEREKSAPTTVAINRMATICS